MSPTDEENDPLLDRALADLPRTLRPTEGYADRVVSRLRSGGVLQRGPGRPRRWLVAATWFIAGVGTGAAALRAILPAPVEVREAATLTRNDQLPESPLEWY
jgi:hypothetical protein